MADEYGPTQLVVLEYHPSTGDPFYNAKSRTRGNWYGFPGYPTMYFDGVTEVVGAPSSPEPYRQIINNRLAVEAPLMLNVLHQVQGTNGQVSASVYLTDTLPQEDLMVHFVLFEDSVMYINDEYRFIVRDILESEPLTISNPGESANILRTFITSPTWVTSHLGVAAFVQSKDTLKTILQAAVSTAPLYRFAMSRVGTQLKAAQADTTVQFMTILKNEGRLADTYSLVLDRDLPPGWTAQYRIGPAVFQDTAMVTLDPSVVNIVFLSVTSTSSGVGRLTLRSRSQSDPNLSDSLSFVLMSGAELLVVDGDDGGDCQAFFETTLNAMEELHGTWPSSWGALTAADLDQFDEVIWLTGDARAEILSTEEMEGLEDYLDGGGRLFITGQDIGKDLGTTTFYRDYLHADCLADDIDILTLSGVPEDPIGDGLSLAISGGDGADNQEHPSVIAPRDHVASAVLTYGSGVEVGGIRVDAGTYKLVYFAFGFEGIDNASDRMTVMERVLGWLRGPSFVEDDSPFAVPLGYELYQNQPNPFNPSTLIPYRISGLKPVILRIYNLQGQMVRTVVDELQEPGHHQALWDGRDHQGNLVASGVYFCRLRVGESEMTRRMALVR